MARKILCVAEKPAIARAVATHMSGGSFQTVSVSHIALKRANFKGSMRFEAINMSRTMSSTSTSEVLGEIAQ
jgi:DNA topoisomerase IA